MSVVVLNRDLVPVGIVDNYESIIWVERYYAYGDFELYLPASKEAIELLKLDYYISIPTSNRLMIIESRKITSSTDSGDYFTVTGRSLESLLTRRVVWDEITFSGNLQDAFETLLTQNFINPSIVDRKIDRLKFVRNTSDWRITSLSLNAKYAGDSIYTIMSEVCDNFKIGFKIELDSDNKFAFSLYKGNDHSYSQDQYPYVVFSKNFDNLISSEYSEESTNFKNVARIGGEIPDAATRKYTSTGEAKGMDRREVFVDASNISSKDGEEEISENVYLQKLKNKGVEELVNYASVRAIDAEVDSSMMYVADRDYFLGDEVQVIDQYNVDTRARITEYIKTYADSGTSVRPTFSIEENYKLPEAYQEVEYLQSSGNQYINTAIIPSSGMAAEVVFRFVTAPTEEQQVFSFYKGLEPSPYSSEATYEVGSICSYNGVVYECTTAINEPEAFNPSHWKTTTAKIRWQCGGYVGETFYTAGYFSYSTSDTTLWTTGYGDYNQEEEGASMYLFAQDYYQTGEATFIGGTKQVKSVIIRQNGTTISHLVPCYRISDGKPGMYDLVRDVFLVNMGTGEFEVGPVVGNLSNPDYSETVTHEYQALEYIESDGNSYIDTKLVTRALGDRINYDFKASVDTISYHYMFGAQAYYDSINPNQNHLYGAVYHTADSVSVRYDEQTYPFDQSNIVDMTQSVSSNSITITVNDSSVTRSIGSNNETNTLLIFASRYANGSLRLYPTPMKLYKLVVRNGDNIVANYQPTRRTVDGAIGVYDTVSGTFYPITGHADPGPDISPVYAGPYRVTPAFRNIVLDTNQKIMSQNVIVEEIPHDTGLISKNNDTLNIV